MGNGFVECDTCRTKAGSPLLCAGCIHNRDRIASLRQQLADAQQAREHWHERYDAALANWNEMIGRAEAAEATVAALRELSAQWRQRANGAIDATKSLDTSDYWQCADELDAVLGALPTPTEDQPQRER